jgi:arylsulfatase A
MHRFFCLAFALTNTCSITLRAEDAPPPPADAPAEHQGSRKVVAAAEDGSITLHASDASVHGSTIRYESKPEKNTVGYWTKADDWASWEFDVAKAGNYEVEVLQGCGKGSGGAEVELSVGDQAVRFTVDDTGGFQNFVARKIGSLTMAAGRQTLSVKAKTKPRVAVMDLRQIVLRPAGAK